MMQNIQISEHSVARVTRKSERQAPGGCEIDLNKSSVWLADRESEAIMICMHVAVDYHFRDIEDVCSASRLRSIIYEVIGWFHFTRITHNKAIMEIFDSSISLNK
jgi:hypothetical protein